MFFCFTLFLLICMPFTAPLCFFFFNDTATTEIYTLSLHDALPISRFPNPAAPAPCSWPSCWAFRTAKASSRTATWAGPSSCRASPRARNRCARSSTPSAASSRAARCCWWMTPSCAAPPPRKSCRWRDFLGGGAAHDGVIHQQHLAALELAADGVELLAHRFLARGLARHDEGPAHVAVLDEAFAVRNAQQLGQLHGAGAAGFGNR